MDFIRRKPLTSSVAEPSVAQDPAEPVSPISPTSPGGSGSRAFSFGPSPAGPVPGQSSGATWEKSAYQEQVYPVASAVSGASNVASSQQHQPGFVAQGPPPPEGFGFYQSPPQGPPPPGFFAGPQQRQLPAGRRWSPGFFARFPFVGMAALSLSVLCTAAAILILLLSNGRPVSEWSGNTQPGVLLAYTSTVANALLGAAFAEALVICFWTRAIEGVPLTSLHYNWASGNSFVGAVKALAQGKAGLISFACILVTITSLLRGPLMQRASVIQTIAGSRSGFIDLQVMPNVSISWAGAITGRSHSDISFTPSFSNVVRDFQNRAPMTLPDVDCANCTMRVHGFGFSPTCTQTEIPFTLASTLNQTDPSWNGYDVFSSNIMSAGSVNATLNVTIQRKTTSACFGQLEIQQCLLSPAEVIYDIFLDRDNVTFASTSPSNDTVVKEIALPPLANNGGTIGALQLFGSSLYTSSCHMSWGGGVGYIKFNTGLLSNTYTTRTLSLGSNFNCSVTFDDPMPDLISSFRELALRMSIAQAADSAAAGQKVVQKVPYDSLSTQVQYGVNFSDLAGAVLVSLVGPFATFLLFWGWWRLGRNFSLSPLEFANAFQPVGNHGFAPGPASTVLDGCNSNASGQSLVKQIKTNGGPVGNPIMQYGVVGGSNRLGVEVAGPHTVRRPQSGEVL